MQRVYTTVNISIMVVNVTLLIGLHSVPNVNITAVRCVRYHHKNILFIVFSFIFTGKDELLIPVHQARFTSDHFSLLNIESYYGDPCLKFSRRKITWS